MKLTVNRQPIVTIITPTYNHEHFIRKCIDSVIAQTFPLWEMIIIDDGSTDRTGDIVKGYNDSRIKYVWQQNQGISSLGESYNKALNLAAGELIAILEGDDWWPANKLAVQVKDFEDDEIVLSFGYTQETSVDEVPIRLRPTRELPAEALENFPVGRACRYFMDMEIMTYFFPVSAMIRKRTLLCLGGFQQLTHLPLVDYPTFIHLARLGRFYFHRQILGYWRRHSESTTRKNYYLINEGVYRYQLEFQREYGSVVPVTSEELCSINRTWQEFKWYQWFTLGRWFMVDGEWANARLAFKRCRPYSYNWKHPALLAFCYICCQIQMDIEWCIDSLQLKPLNEALDIMNREDISLSKAMLDELQEMAGTAL